ncbi:MAG: hypothetical protein AAGC67_18565 [Myxococcota bacterium]
MLRFLAVTTILLTCADHWTTWLCLHAPVSGWNVSEANPVADWLFQQAGLSGGLMIDSLITLGAVFFVLTTPFFDRAVKVGLLGVISCATGYAVMNNVDAIQRMGLSPWPGLV